jgi:hypothetical protein
MCQGLEPQMGAPGSHQFLVLLVRQETQRVAARKGSAAAYCGCSAGANDVIEREFPAVLDQLQGCASLLEVTPSPAQ